MRTEADISSCGLEDCSLLQATRVTRRKINSTNHNAMSKFGEAAPQIAVTAIGYVAIRETKLLVACNDGGVIRNNTNYLLLQIAACQRHGRQNHRGTTPGDRPRTIRCRKGIARQNSDVLGIYAKLLGNDLSDRRLGALTGWSVTIGNRYVTFGIHSQINRRVARPTRCRKV